MKHFTQLNFHENIKIVENIETDGNIGQLILRYISDIVYRIFSTIMIFKTIWFFRHSRWYISPSHNIPDILDILYTFDISNSGIFSQYFWQFWYTRQFNKYRYYPYSQQFRFSKQSRFFCSDSIDISTVLILPHLAYSDILNISNCLPNKPDTSDMHHISKRFRYS